MSQNYTYKQNGGRYLDLYVTLKIMNIQTGRDLRVKINEFILNRVLVSEGCRSGGSVCCLWDGKKDGRVQLPLFIINWIEDNGDKYDLPWRITRDKNNRPSAGSKVTLTWLVCYVGRIQPNTGKDWESFECSHLCLCAGKGKSAWVCITPGHLYWESSSVNQSRGNNYCLRVCHCGCEKSICAMNNLHNPPCL